MNIAQLTSVYKMHFISLALPSAMKIHRKQMGKLGHHAKRVITHSPETTERKNINSQESQPIQSLAPLSPTKLDSFTFIYLALS